MVAEEGEPLIMDGLSRAMAAGVDVCLAGRDWWLLPLTLARLGTCENHLLARRKTPLDRLLGALPHLGGTPPDAQEYFLRRAYNETFASSAIGRIACKDLLAWLDTDEGIAFSAWLCLRSDTGRRLTLPRIGRILKRSTKEEIAELRWRRNMLSGLDLFTLLDWGKGDGKDDGTPIPWRRILRDFSGEPHHFTPRQVGNLTLYSLRIFRSDETAVGGTSKMSMAEAAAFRLKKQAELARIDADADAFIESIMGKRKGM